MNLLIVGCGKVGASLAMIMSNLGHTVSIVDRSSESFDLLSKTFTGFTLSGNAIDQDVLRRAGIEGCDAVAAVTTSDNVNVMVSQVAKEIFGVKKVLTRIYNPAREPVFAAMGLHIICPTSLTVDSATEALTGRDSVQYIEYGGKAMAISIEPAATLTDTATMTSRVPIGLLHVDGSISLLNQMNNSVAIASDRLITAHIVDGEDV